MISMYVIEFFNNDIFSYTDIQKYIQFKEQSLILKLLLYRIMC